MQFAEPIIIGQEASTPVASLDGFLVISESAQEHAPCLSAAVLDSRSPFEELTDVIRQLHQELPQANVRKKNKKKQKNTQMPKGKPRTAPSTAKLRQISNLYAQHFQPVYTSVDIYELHYSCVAQKRISKEADADDQSSTPIVIPSRPLEEENPEKMNQTIQHIINAKLFGTLSDISADEKEKFKNWREFNKHLRRLYEGAHYFTSITKFI